MTYPKGLSKEDIQKRIQNNQTNKGLKPRLKSNTEIVIANVFTPFNLYNIAIAAALIAVHAYTSLLFLGVIVTNTMVFIIQEMRARNLIANLEIVIMPKTTVIRDSSPEVIPNAEIVLDDILLLQAGNQISVDAKVISGSIEANESLLSGEVDPMLKNKDDVLFSGSYVVSGNCLAIATHVGANSYAMKLTGQAITHKPITSKLLHTFKKITKLTSLFVFPMGALLIYQGIGIRSQDVAPVVMSTASALLGMLPQGLVLLTTTSLVASMIKLGKQKALIQELYSIESLSQVDTLCLDKTGTITQGNLSVVKTLALHPNFDDAVNQYVANNTDINFTAKALQVAFTKGETQAVDSVVSFASERKWGAVNFASHTSFMIGAPEIISPEMMLPDEAQRALETGMRVIAVAQQEVPLTPSSKMGSATVLGYILLEDAIREDAAQAIEFFQDNNIDVKIISGDNPITVSQIAKKVGLTHYNHYIDAQTLNSKEAMREAILHYSVIGRATPAQKLEFVEMLQEADKYVAMTGDGINDVLALKASNCAIAMGEGSDAALNVSQVVVMDGKLTTLVDVLKEGRNVVHNITRSASLFYLRTLITFLITIAALILVIPFPFVPLQVTLTNLFASGIPSLMLLFEKDYSKPELQIGQHILVNSLPCALGVIVGWVGLNVLRQVFGISLEHSQTMSFLMNGILALYLVFKVYTPLNRFRTVVFSLNCLGYIVSIMVMWPLLSLHSLGINGIIGTVLISAFAIFISTILSTVIKGHLARKGFKY